MIPSVGVCTRPAESWALNLVVKALVAFSPTYQSASDRATAAKYKFSYCLPGFKFLKPSRIALSVTDEIQRRLIGLWTLACSIIQRATNSPSRALSVATTISPTSGRCNCLFTALNCLLVFLMVISFNFGGIIGRSSSFHVLYVIS